MFQNQTMSLNACENGVFEALNIVLLNTGKGM